MGAYKTIELTDGSEWGCNIEGEGVFMRRADGTWMQQTGTAQTPRFQDAESFSRYLHAHFPDPSGGKLPSMKRRSAKGWM